MTDTDIIKIIKLTHKELTHRLVEANAEIASLQRQLEIAQSKPTLLAIHDSGNWDNVSTYYLLTPPGITGEEVSAKYKQWKHEVYYPAHHAWLADKTDTLPRPDNISPYNFALSLGCVDAQSPKDFYLHEE